MRRSQDRLSLPTKLYRRKIENLYQPLYEPGTREQAATLLRGLIDEIRLTPIEGELGIYLVGDLTAILNLSAQKHPGHKLAGVQTTLVAGARNPLYRTTITHP